MNKEQALHHGETLSALVDGQLRGEGFAHAVDVVLRSEEAQATWHRYHLIGDVLRSNELGDCRGDNAFLARLQLRMKDEPGFARPLSPVLVPSSTLELAAVVQRGAAPGSAVSAAREAANQSGFRWKMLAGVASLAAVAAIGWNLAGGLGLTAGPPQLASNPQPAVLGAAVQLAKVAQDAPVVPVQAAQAPGTPTPPAVTVAGAEEPQVMLRDPRLDELMAAHKQFGGTSALQMPAGFLRNATFEGSAR